MNFINVLRRVIGTHYLIHHGKDSFVQMKSRIAKMNPKDLVNVNRCKRLALKALYAKACVSEKRMGGRNGIKNENEESKREMYRKNENFRKRVFKESQLRP